MASEIADVLDKDENWDALYEALNFAVYGALDEHKLLEQFPKNTLRGEFFSDVLDRLLWNLRNPEEK